MILVTGATGIVGSHIAVDLLKSGRKVRLLIRKGASLMAIQQLLQFHKLEDKFDYFEGNLGDVVSIEEAILGCQEVYHCAAKVSFVKGELEELFEVNVHGTSNVVAACLRHDTKLCYLSSTAAIGDEEIDGLRTEQSRWLSDDDRSDYSLSKRYAELEVLRAVEEGLKAVMVNPCVIMGPGNWGKSSTNVFLSGRNGFVFYPPGGNAVVDARDVARISIDLMSRNPSGRHLLIGKNLSFQDLLTQISYTFGTRGPRILVPTVFLKSLAFILSMLETLRINPFKLSSSSIEATYNTVIYSTAKIEGLGYKFYTLKETLAYTKRVFDLSVGLKNEVLIF